MLSKLCKELYDNICHANRCSKPDMLAVQPQCKQHYRNWHQDCATNRKRADAMVSQGRDSVDVIVLSRRLKIVQLTIL